MVLLMIFVFFTSNISRWFLHAHVSEIVFSIETKNEKKTTIKIYIYAPAQTWRLLPEHGWNAGQEKRASTVGSYHSGARALELDFKFMFQVGYIWISLLPLSALDGEMEMTKSPQRTGCASSVIQWL